MTSKLLKRVLISLALAALLYFLFALYADLELLKQSFLDFNWYLIPILLLLSLANYYLRFFRWEYYLRLLGVKLPIKGSHNIFISGFVMGVTPGKVGELIKPYLIEKFYDYPTIKTIPVIIVERIIDFISLLLIAGVGLFFFESTSLSLIGIGILVIILILLPGNKYFAMLLLKVIGKIPILKKYSKKISTAYENAIALISPKPLFLMIGLSIIAWFFECLGFYIILNFFKPDITLVWSSFVYAFSTVAGAISVLPGGIGVTEGSLTILINNAGFSIDTAVLSTFIIRMTTLWFAVLLGAVSMFKLQKLIGKDEK